MISAISRFFFGSVRRQLVTSVALAHALLMTLFVWDLTMRQHELLLARQVEQAQSIAQSVAISAAGWLAARDLSGLQEIVEAQKKHADLLYMMALDRDGRVLAHTELQRRGQYVTDLPQQLALTTLASSASLVDVATPVMIGELHVGWMRIGLAQHEAQLRLSEITREGIYYALFAIVAGALFAAYIGTRLTARLAVIQSVVDEIKSGHAQARVALDGSDEAAKLAYQFNEMLDALSQREKMLNITQEIAHLGSWELDFANRRFACSDEVYRIFGFVPHEVEPTVDIFFSLIHPEDKERVRDSFRQSINDELDKFELEHRILRHDTGELRYVLEKCTYQRDANGRVVRSIGMVHDVTVARVATLQLERSRDYLHHLFEFVPDALLSINENQLIMSFNAGACAMFGYTASEVVGMPLEQLLPLDARERHAKHVRDFARSGESSRTMGNERKVSGRRKDGSLIELEVNLSSLKVDGQTIFLAAARDITVRLQVEQEREKLQKQLMQAQKMESIGHLTGGIAHDFNNMLGAMMGYAEMLKLLCRDGDETSQRSLKFLGEILTAGNRAKELIAQMLTFSRLHIEKQESAAPVSLLQPIAKEVMLMLRASIPTSVEFELNIPDDALRARIHPVQMHQILLNLVINARDALGEYGRIVIDFRQLTEQGVCQSCHRDFSGSFVEIAVRDSGPGIAAEVLAKIFDPFFTTKEVGKGTGMGLSVVHGIVHAAGGHILVDSTALAGTTFRILLPQVEQNVASNEEGAQSMSSDVMSPLQGIRIMVVDDERVMAGMLEEFLGMYGAQVRAFTRSVEALDVFLKTPDEFDLVITDETMPNLNGIDLSRAILQVRNTLPIILCTGYSNHVDQVLAAKVGIAAFLQKPLDMKGLLEQIRKLHLAA